MASFELFAPSLRNRNADKTGHYSDTAFLIQGNGYEIVRYGYGGADIAEWDENREKAFTDELESLLRSRGWSIIDSEDGIGCPRAKKGESDLYLHPERFDGDVENSERIALEKIFAQAKTFQLKKVLVLAEVYDMTDEQWRENLATRRDSIREELLELFTTKRRNLYICADDAIHRMADRKDIQRLKSHKTASGGRIGSAFSSGGICELFLKEVFQELVDSGEIVSAKTRLGIAYRTVKKDEKSCNTKE